MRNILRSAQAKNSDMLDQLSIQTRNPKSCAFAPGQDEDVGTDNAGELHRRPRELSRFNDLVGLQGLLAKSVLDVALQR